LEIAQISGEETTTRINSRIYPVRHAYYQLSYLGAKPGRSGGEA
jgi:hypothetical protein